MTSEQKPYTFDRVIRILIDLVITVAVIWILRRLSGVLLPFAIALILAFIMDPIVVFIQRFVKKRGRAIFITLFLLLGVMIGFWYLLVPSIGREVGRAGNLIVEYTTTFEVPDWIPENLDEAFKEMAQEERVQALMTPEGIQQIIQKIMPGVWTSLSALSSILFWIIGLFIILLYFIFILADFQTISSTWQNYIPERYRDQAVMLVKDFNGNMTAYFRQQTKIALIECLMFAIGFKILGLPLAITLGIFIGLLYYIPYMQNIGIIPAAFFGLLLSLDTGADFWIIMIEIVAVFAVVAVVQESFLVPKIMGKLTGLNPAIILLSITVWGSLLGILGMIIAIPLTTLLISYYTRFVLKTDIKPSDPVP